MNIMSEVKGIMIKMELMKLFVAGIMFAVTLSIFPLGPMVLQDPPVTVFLLDTWYLLLLFVFLVAILLFKADKMEYSFVVAGAISFLFCFLGFMAGFHFEWTKCVRVVFFCGVIPASLSLLFYLFTELLKKPKAQS